MLILEKIASLFRGTGHRELRPVNPMPRYNCPFYGFNGMFGMFMDNEGNQCGLITDSYSPCPIEMSGKTPNWNGCLFNTEDFRRFLENKAGKIQIFPKEFNPDKKSWDGITLKEWIKYVSDSKTPRP